MKVVAFATACVAGLAIANGARADMPVCSEPEQPRAPGDAAERVVFDPGTHIEVGLAAVGFDDATRGFEAGFAANFSFAYRKQYTSGSDERRVAWSVDHRVLTGFVAPFNTSVESIPRFDAELYRISADRHDSSPSLTLPTAPPTRVAFPFDVGFDAELGHVESVAGPAPWLRINVVRAAFLLDPLRSGHAGRNIDLGAGIRYDIDARWVKGPRVELEHHIAPMTSGLARVRYETNDRTMSFDLSGEIAPEWSSSGDIGVFATASVMIERAIFAVNDRPIAAFASARYERLPEVKGIYQQEGIAELGLAFQIPLRRATPPTPQ